MVENYYLIAYDISSDRKRTALAQFLETIGERINKSVFFCNLPQSGADDLKAKLYDYYDDNDHLIFIKLCKTCAHNVIVLNEKVKKKGRGASASAVASLRALYCS